MALLTTDGVASAWVNQEVGYAVRCGKLVVPLLEDGVKPPGLLQGKEYLRFHRDRLSDALDRGTDFLDRLKTDKEYRRTFEIVGIVVLAASIALIILLAMSGGG